MTLSPNCRIVDRDRRSPSVVWVLVVMLTVLGCEADPAASSDGPADARIADAMFDAAVKDTPAPACVDDDFGFGTQALPATTLSAGQTDGLVVCPPAPDWFALDLPIGRPYALFVQANRAVRLRVGDVVSASGRRPVLRGVVPPGGVIVGIEATDAAAVVRYALTASISVMQCDDVGEPDDTPADAQPLDGSVDGVVCDGDEDVFRVSGPAGARVQLRLAGSEVQGVSLASVVNFDGVGVPIEHAERSINRRLDAAGEAFFAVRPVGSGGRYRISATVEPLQVVEAERTGVVRVPDRAVMPDGLMPATHAPVAGLIIDALVDGEFAGATRTDANGGWALRYAAPSEAEVTVRLRASLWDGLRLVSVGPTTAQPWADSIDETVDLPAESALGRAAHIAQVLASGMRALAPALPRLRVPPSIVVRWTPGGNAPCGTCYQPATDHIELSGRATDPDEWDDAIILHELAHHVAARYGRDDSPGGAHNGGPVAPALAWSEGFATTAAAWILATPLVLDSRATGVRSLSLELMDDPRAFGTANDAADGAISEYLVAAILWDLLDTPAMDDDAEAVDPMDFFGAAFTGLALRAVDSGAPGADLLDHADEIACRTPVDWTTLLESRDVAAPIACRMKPASLLSADKGALRVRCAGWLTQGGLERWVNVDDRVPNDAVARLDCGGLIEHFDPAPASELRWGWRVIAGAAQPDLSR